MANRKEDLYILIGPDNYRIAKSQVLESQAGLLKVMKHLQNLKFLSRQKLDLQVQLHTLFEMLVGETNLMEKNLPKPILPKIIQQEAVVVPGEIPQEIKRDYSKRDEIDAELQSIKEKLKMLNS